MKAHWPTPTPDYRRWDRCPVPPGLLGRKGKGLETLWAPPATSKTLLPSQVAACGLRSPKACLPGLPLQLPHLPGRGAAGPRADPGPPAQGGPQAHFALAPRVTHSYRLRTARCLPQSFFPTEEGEGARETWPSSKGPRPLSTAVALQLEGIKGREGRAGHRRQLPADLPAAPTPLPP